ncbi:MAG: ADOP family duplicated permease [Terriglobia bacterium]
MSWTRFFRRRYWDEERARELEAYLEAETDENIARGMSPEEARYAAHRKLGNTTLIREEIYHMNSLGRLETLWQDVRFGHRQLRRSFGFTAVAVLTLALGLAAVNTIFAVVETVLLRPLDYPHSERIFSISQAMPTLGSGPTVVTLREFQRWEKTGLFEHAAAMDTTEHTLLGSAHPERLLGVRVTPDFFRVFGVQPFLGRGFVAGDATPGHDNVMVLSYRVWRGSFGGDPGVVGKPVRMSEGPMTVIGVMPPRFDFPRLADVRTIMFWAPERTDFWTPLAITERLVGEGNFNYYMLGRLRDGVTPQRASEQFRAGAIQIFRDEEVKEPADRSELEQIIASLAVYVVPLRDSMAWGVGETLWMLLAAVGLLLALVLFNLGNLLLTRNTNRFREFVVREALGATHRQLFRQSFIEQMLLVAGAAVISLGLAEWGVSAIRAVAGERLPRLYGLSIDLRVTALLAALSFLIAIVFGALPLLVVRNSRLSGALQSEGRSLTGDRRTNRLKSSLMVLQIAVSMVLLIGAGLLIQSFTNVMRVKPGFDPHNLLNITVSLDPKINRNSATRLAHLHELLDAFRSIPGVESAAVVNHVPLTGEVDIHDPRAVGRPLGGLTEGAEYRVVNATYFRTMRIPLVEGREFREDEPEGFALVNRKMASHLWPDEDALGKQFRDGDNPPVTVVGIVGDIHDGSLEREPRMQFYLPLAANPWYGECFMIRSRIDAAALLPAIQQTVWRLDPEEPVSHPQTMERLLQSVTLDRRFETGLVAGFAGAALFLAMLGLFSIASLSIARRTREFGLRLALGAEATDLLRLALVRTLGLVVAGLACGGAASLALAKAVAGFLYGVPPWSPVVYGAAIAALIVPAFVAAWLPARRAAKVDPMVALRYE